MTTMRARRSESAPPRLYLVYDSACGDCAGMARRAAALFGVPIALRSCRDPRPDWRADAVPAGRPCRRPLLVLRWPDGRVQEAAGVDLWWRALLLVPWRRWPAGLRLWIQVVRVRRSPAG